MVSGCHGHSPYRPCSAGERPVRKLGHTAALAIGDGDVTRPQTPWAARACRAGNFPASMSCRTNVASAASMPMASTRVPLEGLIEELLKGDPSPLRRRAGRPLEDGERLEIVAPAGLGLHAVGDRASELSQQRELLHLGARATPHQARIAAMRAPHQPAVEDV